MGSQDNKMFQGGIMKRAVLAVVTLVVLLGSGRTLFATEVKTDYDREANFAQYKTFCWQKVETQIPLWIERIKSAVGSTLAAKGWSQVAASSGCDLAVVAIEINRR